MRSVAPGPSCLSRKALRSGSPSLLVAITLMSRATAPVMMARLTYSASGSNRSSRSGYRPSGPRRSPEMAA